MSQNTTTRPPNAYNLFVKCPENRETYAGSNPRETMSNLGAAWKSLSEDDRTHWTDLAASAKQEWEANGGAPEKSKSKASKKKKKGRAPTAYNLFVKDPENRETHAGDDAKETMRNLGAAWKALSDEEKEIWTEKAIEAKAEFEAKQSHSEDSDDEPKKKKKGRAPTAYNLFVKDPENRETHAGDDAKETMRNLGAAWKALSDEEKEIWTEKAVEAKAEFEAKQSHSEDSDDEPKKAPKAKKSKAKKAKKAKKSKSKATVSESSESSESDGDEEKTGFRVFLDSEEQRDAFRRSEEGSGKSDGEIRLLMSKAWIGFSDEERQPFEEQAMA